MGNGKLMNDASQMMNPERVVIAPTKVRDFGVLNKIPYFSRGDNHTLGIHHLRSIIHHSSFIIKKRCCRCKR
ncbi:MAG TPA: hypothetical protein ENJ53_07530 [Phaeodactylibacter sp.]|nr:hypothetical protein [Phaeodactylibacter sp.]